MKKSIGIIIVLSLLLVSQSYAKSDWEFHFFGINMNDLKGRSVWKITGGIATSLVVHEMGHFIAGDVMGMNPYIDDGFTIMANYDDKSNDQIALFHSAGFLAQDLVGSILTIAPSTRHEDFTVGFNGFTTFNSISYGTIGEKGGGSDVQNINDRGWNGNFIAIGSGVFTGVLTYINLDKYKEVE